ncbi:MarR family transcriptional regulator [Novosphingobium sp. JCM 18896]|uniref:MarR family transcriptional regulator n=1 Tax=Novosphingobium sp. JCM 18896 TaxID=2989731 RepID=UPI0022222619|nr:MarR family transcriptional regulator [Novosphingobium sp. JCM 18896]MCW1431717.1 MarR family transcriptional regulator [Novosphingobium sp. JCM 18896]
MDPLADVSKPRNLDERRGSEDRLSWDDLGLLVDGLAHGLLPLKTATQGVTARYDLGPRGAWILSLISGGVRTPKDLARALHTSRALVTIELNRVTKAGLVEGRPDVNDKRQLDLALTELGASACAHVRREMARIVTRNMAPYTADEIRLVARALRDVRRLEAGDGDFPV